MAAPKVDQFVSPPVHECAGSDFDPLSIAVTTSQFDEENRRAWDRLIDEKLIEWGRNPQQLIDDGVEPPSGDVIRLAIELANHMKIRGLAAPSSVIPDPNGGVVFERREGDVSEVFHIWDDGTVEYQLFVQGRVARRWVL